MVEDVESSNSAPSDFSVAPRFDALGLLDEPIGRQPPLNSFTGPGADSCFNQEVEVPPCSHSELPLEPDSVEVISDDGSFSLVTGLDSGYDPSIFHGYDNLEPEDTAGVNTLEVAASDWNILIAGSFSDYREKHHGLALPWESGACAGIFADDFSPAMPVCCSIPEIGPTGNTSSSEGNVLSQVSTLPIDAKYVHIVQSVKDLDYFEGKALQLEKACAQWLQILSVNWEASGVGLQVAASLQADNTGAGATEILKACFGVKSPSTLLKRASAVRSFINWFERNEYGRYSGDLVLPFQEDAVWYYFLWLKEQRMTNRRGFTSAASFLEALRFCKYVLDFGDIDKVAASRRLQGFAAIQKSAKGPLRQAPGLELEHIQRLHQVLRSDGNPIDTLAAACFLICLYGRARWSDIRFIQYVEIDNNRNGSLTLYTSEHKTAGVGLKREQFLPLIIPWQGVTSDPWIETFLDLYSFLGLDIGKRPLGPLMPAPRPSGGFYARPVTTTEAAKWLRALLEGTSNSESFRSHSLKASLLLWCAQAGFDKETRAVLGHHCSSLTGSDVIYSRHLQVRAIRKLSMLLRRVRIGLSIEDENMQTMGLLTPAAMTPAFLGTVANKPVEPILQHESLEKLKPLNASEAINAAVEDAQNLQDLESVKEELFDEHACVQASANLSLFPQELVDAGLIAVDSSSGSDSSSDSSEDSSPDLEVPPQPEPKIRFTESIPEGFDFFRRKKSSIMHRCKSGTQISFCNVTMSSNFIPVERVFHIKWPKCLKCFSGCHNRITKLSDMSDAIGNALKRAKPSK